MRDARLEEQLVTATPASKILRTYRKREVSASDAPARAQKRVDLRPASMSFFAPVNERYVKRGARGVSTEATSGSATVAVLVACTIVGLGVAFFVTVLHLAAHGITSLRTKAVEVVRAAAYGGPPAALALATGLTYTLLLGAFGCVVVVPHARGSGVPN